MKQLLRVSLLLNCALLGCVAFSLLSKQRTRPAAEAASGAAEPVARAEQPFATSLPAEAKPFHWRQVESANYHTYVANLRSIGCPEQTIQDIITADVASLYAGRRQPLEAKLASARFAERLALEAELRALRAQEASLIAALLGPAPDSAHMATAEMQEAVSLPLVFRSVDPSAVELDAGQVEVITRLRERFIDQIGGPNQDPHDPGYRQRWLQSQPQVDDDLRGMLGANTYQDYQLAARAAAMAPEPTCSSAH